MRFRERERRDRDLEAREEGDDARGGGPRRSRLPAARPGGGRRTRRTNRRARSTGSALEEWKHGDIAKAVELFEQAVAADPDDRVPRSHLGRLLTLMTDYERALPHLERAAALAPDDPQVWLDLQTLYERSQRLDGAFEARARAEALAQGRPIVAGLGRASDGSRTSEQVP